jgi:hypothetical protein
MGRNGLLKNRKFQPKFPDHAIPPPYIYGQEKSKDQIQDHNGNEEGHNVGRGNRFFEHQTQVCYSSLGCEIEILALWDGEVGKKPKRLPLHARFDYPD